jgi:glycoside/pentoside/hexuronide:cation symporter, GPH family
MARQQGPGETLPSRWRLAAFASPITPVTVAFLPLVLLIPGFYAQDMGIPVAAVGGALLIARLFDAISDPLIGALSDRTRSRWGRRRPWIVAGTPVLMLGVWALFLPSGTPSLPQLYASVLLVYLGWTLVFIPHQAWGAELQRSYEGRTRLNVFMGLFNAMGTVLCLLLPFLVLSPQAQPLKRFLFGWALDGDTWLPDAAVRILSHDDASRVPFSEIVAMLAVIVMVLLPLSVLLCVTTNREVPTTPAQVNWRSAINVWRENKPFARMVIGAIFVQISVQLWTAAQPFYLSAVLGEPDLFLLLLIINQVFALLTVPAWGFIARAIGRARGLAVAGLMMIMGFALLFLVPTLAPGYGVLLPTIAAYLFLGAASDGKWMMPIGLAADSADYYEWKTGKKEAGLHLSMMFFANKIGIASGGLTLIAFGLFGFQPGSPDNSPQSIEAVKYLSTVVPIVCSAIGMAVLWNWRITPRAQEAIRRRIARRAQSVSASGDLA